MNLYKNKNLEIEENVKIERDGKMKKVGKFINLDTEVQDYLIRMNNRTDNIYEMKSYVSSKKLKSKVININLDNYWNNFYNDLDFVKEIDSFDLSTSQKLLFYIFYNPIFISKEELFNFLQKTNYNSVDLRSMKGRGFDRIIIKDLLQFKGCSLSSNNTEIHTAMFLYKNKGKETIENIIHLNDFLTNADDNETYNQYYFSHNKIEVFNHSNSFLNFEIFKDYKNSSFILNILQTFNNNTVGSMSDYVNRDTIEKLKTIPKSLYVKLLKNNNECKTIKSLISIIDVIEKEGKNRKNSENVEILLRIIFDKILHTDKIGIYTNLGMIRDFHLHMIDNEIYNSLYTEITDMIVEEKDNLSILEILSLLLAISSNNNKGSKFWIRTGTNIDCFSLLIDLAKKDLIGTAKILEYLALEYKKQPPTITQWKKIISDDLLSAIPYLAIDLVNNTDKINSVSEDIASLRFNYKKGKIK